MTYSLRLYSDCNKVAACCSKLRKSHQIWEITNLNGRRKKLMKKETLAQVFSSEFCEILKKIFFTKHLRATTFVFN